MRTTIVLVAAAVLARPISQAAFDAARAVRATLTLHRMDLKANPTSGL